MDEPLPLPPNQTHTQYLFPYFTHREEPPMALVALGIWNQTEQYDLPTDRNPGESTRVVEVGQNGTWCANAC